MISNIEQSVKTFVSNHPEGITRTRTLHTLGFDTVYNSVVLNDEYVIFMSTKIIFWRKFWSYEKKSTAYN